MYSFNEVKYWKHICFWYSDLETKICRKYWHYWTWLLSKAELIIESEWSVHLQKTNSQKPNQPNKQKQA